MSCNKPRVSVFVDEELLAQIEDFRYDSRCVDRSDAIRRLIKAGLKTFGEDDEASADVACDKIENGDRS